MEITPQLLTFGVLASIAAGAAVGVVVFANALKSALCLVLNFFMIALIYFTLNAEMIGITQVVVYAGAIMVLFLFVIMILNLGGKDALVQKNDTKLVIGGLLGFSFFAMLSIQILPPLMKYTSPYGLDNYGAPESLGKALFSSYVFPVEVTGILLLVGIVGSIFLAKRRI